MKYVASVIIPLLRQVDAWLEQCVSSALQQCVPTEVVVVRSEMTPPSNLKILARLQNQHKNLQIISERRARSFPNAINTGFESARTDRVGLLLSDDWLDRKAVAACMEKSADIVSTGNCVYLPDGRVNKAASRVPSMARFRRLRTLEEQASYLQHFFLFRRETALRVRLDESIGNYPGIDDYDFIWTLLEHSASVEIVPMQLYHYRDHDGERLTLVNRDLALNNLTKILHKHKIKESEMPSIIDCHVAWFGKPIYKVMYPHWPKMIKAGTMRNHIAPVLQILGCWPNMGYSGRRNEDEER
jgi:glycosyltransferase involved in cell wall biosynthesis